MNEQLKLFMLSASVGDLWYLSNANPAGSPVTRWVFTSVPGNNNPDPGAVERDAVAGILNGLSLIHI